MAGARQERRFKLVTRLSLLGTPKVRFVFTAPSPQLTDLKLSMHSACHVYYHSRKKIIISKSQDRSDREGTRGCGQPH